MTRKHFELIAKAIYNNRYNQFNWDDFIMELCQIFQDNNERFDADKFVEACNGG